jgi:hypothetical protein
MNAPGFASIAVFAVTVCACNAGAPGPSPISAMPFAGLGNGSPSQKIYVANIGDDTITTYKLDGTQTTPTINTGISYLVALAVDANGKIYALSFDGLEGRDASGTVTTYTPDGSPSTPAFTVKERGYREALGIGVDAGGKIYVLSGAHNGSRGIVTTYTSNGTPTMPTFRTGADSSSLTIDQNGKIYVTNDTGTDGKSSVTTYLPNGSPTTPTITRGLTQPDGLAIDASGTIYVANTTNGGPDGTGAGYVTTYTSNGGRPARRFAHAAGAPAGVASANDHVYVASSTAYRSIVKTYNSDGSRIGPTITAGLYEPSGIVIH